MARPVTLEPGKTYATRYNLEQAIAKLEEAGVVSSTDRYLVCLTVEGRLYPVFLYNERTSHFMPAVLAHRGFCSIN